MAGLPAICPSCGNYFNTGVQITGNVVMMGCTTTCPRCGSGADVLDGEYSAVAGALGIANRKPLTAKHYEQVSGMLKELAELNANDPNGILTEEMVEIASAISPEIGAAFKFLREGKVNWAGAALLVGAIMYQSSAGGCTLNIDQSQHITNQITIPTKVENTALHSPTQKNMDEFD